MRIYLIRHGVTKSNLENVRQSREGYLSEDGIQQSRALASKLSGLAIDSIFTSSYPRARQTADIISALGKGFLVQESQYLEEIRLPSEVVGKPVEDQKSKNILSRLWSHRTNPSWRYSDEETFKEYVSRAHFVLDHISNTGFKNVVVVTHHRFIEVLVGIVLLKEKLTPALFAELKERLYVSNTGITIIDQNQGGGWRLFTLNEHSHIEERAAGSS